MGQAGPGPPLGLVSEALLFHHQGRLTLLLRTNASVNKIIKALDEAAGQIETIEPRPDALRLHGGPQVLVVFKEGTDAGEIINAVAHL